MEIRVVITNELGLHARPAARFVKLAAKYLSSVQVERDGSAVDGKSIMGVMMLEAECGAEIIIRTEGVDADEAATALSQLIAEGFGE